MLTSKLAKLASLGARLREVAIEKQAGPIGGLATLAANHPVKALGAAATVGFGGMQAVGQTRQNYQGFQPEVQAARLGQIPVPPTTQQGRQ